MTIQTIRIATPLRCDLVVSSDGERITASSFETPKAAISSATRAGPLLKEARAQVRAYFRRSLRTFDLPLLVEGTPFCRDVWQAVASLSFGQFVSYADVARAVGRPLAHRGVATAMGRTPLDLFVPAHRVVGADGRIRGASPGSTRARLVDFERAQERTAAARKNSQ